MTISPARWARVPLLILALLTLLVLAACQETAEEPGIAAPPTAEPLPTADLPVERTGRDFVVVATDAPLPPFTNFDQFGTITGFNSGVMQGIAARAGLDFEFVVTPNEGVLASIAAGSARDFDAVMSALVIPDTPPPGIAYTEPYLEIGQVILVLADEQEILSAGDLRPGMAIGVLPESDSLESALELGLAESDLFTAYERPSQLIQALIDESVDAVIVDSFMGQYFANTFPEQLRLVGDADGQATWLDSRAYGIAVAADNTELLTRLNDAIDDLRAEGELDRLAVTWLLAEQDAAAAVDPGESRIGTPGSELFIGVVGSFTDMDPASLTVDFISWEIKQNTMSGLYRISPDSEVQPLLAAALPTVSEDKLEYTIPLRDGLLFPDGSGFTADDVKWSIDRAAGMGNFLVNNYLKDTNEDNFADGDAVQVIDPLTVKIVLKQPTAYFPAILASPPFTPISSDCFAPTADPGSTCGGIGPYTIVGWTPNDRLRLAANPGWPGTPAPAFPNLMIRFFSDVTSMERSLVEFESVDLAWTGLPFTDFARLSAQDADQDGGPDLRAWVGPSTFKSYFIFDQATPPWDKKRVRQAVAYALDRDALARDVFGGGRLPLLSPVPNDIPGHLDTLPARDLERARALLLEEGYSPGVPLDIAIWYVNDGRYSPVEEAYVNAIKVQLEETEVFRVTVNGVGWDEFRLQTAQCAYPAYILGWPSPGAPTEYMDATSWTTFFVENPTRVFCSNYESERMTTLVAEARAELDEAARLTKYGEIQTLWADELPTLDITQEPRRAISLPGIDGVQINAWGMLHYELLTKVEPAE
jgi:peptide/nickel transport system substrate-binding protein